MKFSEQYDIGALVDCRFGGMSATVDAEVNGVVVDRDDRNSAVVTLSYSSGDLAVDETVTLSANIQHGDLADGSDMADYTRSDVFGPEAFVTATGLIQFSVRLDEAKRYVRAQYTVATSAIGTASSSVTAVLGGGSKTPI